MPVFEHNYPELANLIRIDPKTTLSALTEAQGIYVSSSPQVWTKPVTVSAFWCRRADSLYFQNVDCYLSEYVIKDSNLKLARQKVARKIVKSHWDVFPNWPYPFC